MECPFSPARGVPVAETRRGYHSSGPLQVDEVPIAPRDSGGSRQRTQGRL